MLNNWLSPVNEDTVSSFFNSVYYPKSDFPNLEGAKVVFFTKSHEFSALLRNKMSLLFNHFKASIVDIGNISPNNNSSIYQVISELQDGYILPVLIGIDQKSFLEFCKAMSLEGKLGTAAYISNTAVSSNDSYAIENIGYQRHFTPKYVLEEINDSNTPGLSLGALRAHHKIVEPILREVNYLHFDLAAMRRSECRGVSNALPTGLNAEEACQIMRYIGEGSRIKLVTLDTTGLSNDDQIEALLTSELLWYLFEGVDLRLEDHPTISSDFKEFVIELNDVDHSLVFFQSNKTGKWWLKKEENTNKYISCAYEEYQQSINNDIPDRLLKLL